MKKIVFTGGPSGGKTSIIEILQRDFGRRVAVVPEAATILYLGGFPRLSHPEARRCVQRAVYFVQRELEAQTAATARAEVLLCDRGTMDGPAYWPGDGSGFWKAVATTPGREAARYDLAFHLRTPQGSGYRLAGTRNETPRQALRIDARIERAWAGHPRRFVIENTGQFIHKVHEVRAILARELPEVFRR